MLHRSVTVQLSVTLLFSQDRQISFLYQLFVSGLNAGKNSPFFLTSHRPSGIERAGRLKKTRYPARVGLGVTNPGLRVFPQQRQNIRRLCPTGQPVAMRKQCDLFSLVDLSWRCLHAVIKVRSHRKLRILGGIASYALTIGPARSLG